MQVHNLIVHNGPHNSHTHTHTHTHTYCTGTYTRTHILYRYIHTRTHILCRYTHARTHILCRYVHTHTHILYRYVHTHAHTHTVQVHTHAHTPWFIQAGVIGVCAEGDPVLAILRDLEGPVPQCRPAIAARVSQCVGRWDNSQTQVNRKPCIPANRTSTCKLCTPCLTVSQVGLTYVSTMYLNIASIHTQVHCLSITPYTTVQHLSIPLYTTVQHLSITLYTSVHHLSISLYTTV